MEFVLRDGEVLRGGLFLNEGQALAPYLGSRKGGWVNVVDAAWLKDGETHHHHLALQSDHILLARSLDGDIPVFGSVARMTIREVDITLEDATRVAGGLQLSEMQRLADYLHSCGRFLPVLNAQRVPAGVSMGDYALNCLAVRVVRDSKVFDPGSMEVADERAAEPSTADRPSLNTDVVPRGTGPIRVITEPRVPDRRSGPSITAPTGAPPVAARRPDATELAGAVQALERALADHWLVRASVARQLLPPDPRDLPASPSLEGIWTGLARRNGLPDSEIAAAVAAFFKLELADLEQISPAALAAIPERVARKLGVMPLTMDGKNAVIAVSDPGSVAIERQLRFVTRMALQFRIAAPSDIRSAIDRFYVDSGVDSGAGSGMGSGTG